MVRFSFGIVRIAINLSENSWEFMNGTYRTHRTYRPIGPMSPISPIRDRFSFFTSGGARAANHFEQEFKYFHVAPGFIHALSPGVKAVPAQQEPVRVRALAEKILQLARDGAHILRIVQDRQPLLMLVCVHTGQTFEHLVA